MSFLYYESHPRGTTDLLSSFCGSSRSTSCSYWRGASPLKHSATKMTPFTTVTFYIRKLTYKVQPSKRDDINSNYLRNYSFNTWHDEKRERSTGNIINNTRVRIQWTWLAIGVVWEPLYSWYSQRNCFLFRYICFYFYESSHESERSRNWMYR